MTITVTVDQWSPGFQARRLRLSQQLTQQELASIAGVPLLEVSLFEQSLPVPLDTRRKLLRELWARKAGLPAFQILP